ncbi:MAG: hypothetical protein CBC78_000680 [Candidatus Pelagibacter sp. TMED118]|nr:MAG: hypothetical protein CBC78_000680 [Candidatus Pelagibacter sp. TMED118]|tara:strand:+ start:3029 stop:3418 length:390 start_codon:yes stop_codon:yes gene_type:complete
MQKILVEISVAELLDKISILSIKMSKIKNKNKNKLIKNEMNILNSYLKKNLKINKKIRNYQKLLLKVNLSLWNIEDNIRKKEKIKNFGNEFIDLARKVYINNDKRSKIKLKINKYFGSNIVEVKSYSKY